MRHQLVLERLGPVLERPEGGTLAGAERLRLWLAEGRLWVEGQVTADRVALEVDGQRRSAAPQIHSLGAPRFVLSLPYRPGPARLVIDRAGSKESLDLPVFSRRHLALAQLRLWPRFGWQLAQALPAGINWLRYRDPASRDRVKRLLGLVHSADLLLDPAIFRPSPSSPAAATTPDSAEAAGAIDDAKAAARAIDPAQPVTILLPVYQAYDLLRLCLDHLARHSQDLPWRLIAIEDGSPDPRILPLLHEFQRSRPEGQVEILQNPVNLGFIGAVNRGLSRALEETPPAALAVKAGPAALAAKDGPAALAAKDGPAAVAAEDKPAALGQSPAAGVLPRAPIILLNTDALVPPGWLPRLIAPLLADPGRVASVTPMSNDAELVTVPRISARLDLLPGEALAIDKVAASFHSGQALASAPTGVGFCMALNPRFLALEPQLDPAFGRGYGEEVDWCQRVARHGGQHLYQPGLFVEHRGGSSFGTAEKQRLLAENAARLTRLYPDFDLEVQHWVSEDPLITPRLALGLALLAARAKALARAQQNLHETLLSGSNKANQAQIDLPVPTEQVPIYLAHSLGGGAEHWLQSQIEQDLARQGGAVVLRVGGARRWRIELYGPTGLLAGSTDDLALVKELLALLPARRLIYSCGVGDPDPLELPALLLDLTEGPTHRLEILLHDYFPLSPSYTLLDRNGSYNGLPRPGESSDIAHTLLRPDGSRASLAEWRAAWDAAVARAAAVVAFSPASQALASEAWPDLGARLILRPHQPTSLPPRLVPPLTPPAAAPAGRADADEKRELGKPAAPAAMVKEQVIGVPGNIGAHKGAELLVALSRLLARRSKDLPEVRLVVMGDLDPAYALARPARVHGPYQPSEFAALARRYGITDWLIPSIWPETFSFTTHEALATGLPVWCLDLGAQADAVRAARAAGAPGGVIPLDASRDKTPARSLPLSPRLLAERVLAQITGSADPGYSG